MFIKLVLPSAKPRREQGQPELRQLQISQSNIGTCLCQPHPKANRYSQDASLATDASRHGTTASAGKPNLLDYAVRQFFTYLAITARHAPTHHFDSETQEKNLRRRMLHLVSPTQHSLKVYVPPRQAPTTSPSWWPCSTRFQPANVGARLMISKRCHDGPKAPGISGFMHAAARGIHQAKFRNSCSRQVARHD